VVWVADTRKIVRGFHEDVRQVFGRALLLAQQGGKDVRAKPLKGFGSASVLEIVADHNSGTFRLVYTSRFAGRLYVLHAFQKKSRRGARTPLRDIRLIQERLRAAELEHARETSGHSNED
jgi:phage-related protein